jgi:hypothetical protein
MLFNSPSADLGLLADAVESLSEAAPAAPNSSMDTSSSSVLAPASTSFSSEEAFIIASVSREPISAELMSAVKSSAPETVSAAAASVSSLSISSAAQLQYLHSQSLLQQQFQYPHSQSLLQQLQMDHLCHLKMMSYSNHPTKKGREHENLFFVKSKMPWLNAYRYLNRNAGSCVSSLLRLPQNRNHINII